MTGEAPQQGMLPTERLPFVGIPERPPLRFPDGVRLVIWPVFALEHWDIARPMARMVISPPQGQPQLPDHPNWSWHEYGMRVGFWRIRQVFDRLGVRPTVTLNAQDLRDLSERRQGLPRQRLGAQRAQL